MSNEIHSPWARSTGPQEDSQPFFFITTHVKHGYFVPYQDWGGIDSIPITILDGLNDAPDIPAGCSIFQLDDTPQFIDFDDDFDHAARLMTQLFQKEEKSTTPFEGLIRNRRVANFFLQQLMGVDERQIYSKSDAQKEQIASDLEPFLGDISGLNDFSDILNKLSDENFIRLLLQINNLERIHDYPAQLKKWNDLGDYKDKILGTFLTYAGLYSLFGGRNSFMLTNAFENKAIGETEFLNEMNFRGFRFGGTGMATIRLMDNAREILRGPEAKKPDTVPKPDPLPLKPLAYVINPVSSQPSPWSTPPKAPVQLPVIHQKEKPSPSNAPSPWAAP